MKNGFMRTFVIILAFLVLFEITALFSLYHLVPFILLSILLFMTLILLFRYIPKYDKLTNTYRYITFKDKYYSLEGRKALIYIDINNSSLIEKIYSKSKKDEIIKEISKIIKKNINTDLITRKTVDRFLVCVKYSSRESLENLVKRIYKEVQNLELADLYVITCSFGISICGKNSIEEEEWKCYAALKEAKEHYSKYYSFYEEEDFEEKVINKKAVDELVYAIKNNQLLVYLQPIYDTDTKKISGAEALVRMKKDNKIVPAGKFITTAQKEGLISLIDKYVINEVCLLIEKFKKEHVDFKKIAVNVSRETLEDEDSIEYYKEVFKKHGVDNGDIELEITERNNNESEIESLKSSIKHLEKNFNLSLDDFGTGYSTLSMISEYNIKTLKIDRSFISNDIEKNKKIIKYLILLAKELGIDTVAEGVESKEQYNYLKKVGCKKIQGYYFAQALTSDDFKELVLKEK